MSRGQHTVLNGPAGGPTVVLVSAEHGGNHVPEPYEGLFRGQEDLLASHRGWDPGTAGLARQLAAALDAPVLVADVTRLLVDLNRSAHHPRVFSELTRALQRTERSTLLVPEPQR